MRLWHVAETLSQTSKSGVAGSLFWMPPDLLGETGHASAEGGAYSVGTMVVKQPYESNLALPQVMVRVKQGRRPPIDELVGGPSAAANIDGGGAFGHAAVTFIVCIPLRCGGAASWPAWLHRSAGRPK